MCYTIKQTSEAIKLEHRFNARYLSLEHKVLSDHLNGFTFPKVRVITCEHPTMIQLFDWGLLPSWSKDMSLRKNTLNARVETISEKASFRSYVHNKCLVLVDGFYEWKWLDEGGKHKEKYLMYLPSDEPFALGGIYAPFTDRTTGEVMNTFSILTTSANEQMAEIHNTKKRMPLYLDKKEEMDWLMSDEIPKPMDIQTIFETRLIVKN